MLARQRGDASRGRFSERLTVYNFDLRSSSRQQQIVHKVQSMGGAFVRVVSMRGTVAFSTQSEFLGVEMAALRLRVQLNGQQDLVTADGQPIDSHNGVSFAMLFAGDQQNFADAGAQQDAPPFYFIVPPKLRVSDNLALTVTSVINIGEGTPELTCQLVLTLMDNDLYEDLYMRTGPAWNPAAVRNGGQP